ncbi:T9SS type A sorting domain-containing protein [Ulvibacter sp. MAR_2010_11]|uniref:T9SS type A sorting domain-containing protein n=1 Tax=Ulvibacter sp. MAR_2010_11 TaxID=1250229 RepID=UPI000C2C3CFD|nr:T9SS type A sorting domain-containing protein [Ulvibacter sp. MAR_2010_11]
MITKKLLIIMFLAVFSWTIHAQENVVAKAVYSGTVSSVEYVTPMLSRLNDLTPSDNSEKEAKDKRSIANQIVSGQDPQTENDFFVRNRNEMEQSVRMAPASLVFDAYTSGSQPTDPSLAVGPNHVMVVFNTGFAIYDKSGNQLLGQTSPNPAIFPSGGCCDLTASYDNAADRWVLTFLGSGAQIAVSDGPNPLTAGWYVYNIAAIQDYQKLSVWSDGYYITENTSGSNKVWALERSAMLAGSPSAKIQGFNLPGLVTSGFFSPQVLNVTDDNLPAAGGATVIYMQDNAWNGVTTDHIKLWTINVDWANTSNSTISSAQQITTTPFISVFDNGSFSNLRQPGSGRPINVDALQATIMNQAQFRKFATHNSAVFNFVVDTDASSEELAGIRWYEFRQSSDNQPWSLYQEGTYTAPDGRHAWHASLAMDGQGNIGMGYTSMSGPTTPSTVYISSYFTGRLSTDPLGTMTGAEELISNGTGKIPGTRYGDYSKIDVDPSDDSTFWFINEYYKSGRKGVVGVFQIEAGPADTQPPSTPTNLTASNITASGATLSWNASTDNVGVDHYNISINGSVVGTSATTSFNVSGLAPLTQYSASVNAQDAAGNTSGSANTTFTTIAGGGGNPGEIAAYYFETGLDGWIDGGNDCARQQSSNSYEGSYSIRLRDGSSTSNAVSPSLNLSGNTQVSIEFHTNSSGMENGKSFFVEFFDGTSYQTIGQYISGTHFTNGTFFNGNITLNSGSYSFNSNNRIRFRNAGTSNNDQLWFDQVIITGDNALAGSNEPANRDVVKSFAENASEAIKLHPNPTTSNLTIEMLDMKFDEIIVFSSLGTVIKTIDPDSDNLTIDVSNLASGMYFVRFVSEGLAVTKRFIKE